MRFRRLILAVCLALLTLATMAPAVSCGFVSYDDGVFVTDNPQVRGPLDWANIRYEFTHQIALFYHPLSLLSLMLDHAMWGLNPAGYHAENVLIHTLSVVLLFLILAEITGELARPAIAAAIWAIHPLRVESVVWIAERKDVLAMVMALAALWSYVRLARLDDHPERRRWPWHVAILLLLALSLLAKPAYVTLPGMMLLLDFWPLRRFERVSWKKLLIEKIPLCLLIAVWIKWIFHIGEPPPGTMTPLFPVPSLHARIANAIVSYVRYLGSQFTLTRLSVPYPIHVQGWPAWQVIASALLIAGVTVFCIAQRRKRPWLTVGWLWYCITLFPMSGIAYIGDFSVADRYSYMPSIGLAIALAWSAPDRWLRPAQRGGALPAAGRAVALAVIALISTLIVFTCKQIGYWHDSTTLFAHSISVDDGSVAELDYGAAMMQAGQYAQAIDHFQKAIAFYPQFANAWNNLGAAWGALGDMQRAIACLEQAIRFYPQLASAHRALGAALLRTGNLSGSGTELKESIKLDPTNAGGHAELGFWYIATNHPRNAANEFKIALQYQPNDPALKNDLAVIRMRIARQNRGEPQHGAASQSATRKTTP